MIISFHFTVLSMGDVKLSFLDFLIDSAVRRLSFEIWIYTFLGKFNRIFGLSVESCKKGCKFVPFWGHFWYFILFSFAFYLIFSYSATKLKKITTQGLANLKPCVISDNLSRIVNHTQFLSSFMNDALLELTFCTCIVSWFH